MENKCLVCGGRMMEYKRLTEKDWHKEKFYPKTENDRAIRKRLWNLENQIEQGTLIELPCKVGDTVYNTDGIRVYQGEIMEISLTPKHFIFTEDTVCFDERAIGTRVFLTREEAEKRLKELSNDNK